MAYFCLTVVVDSTGLKKGKFPSAAAKYGVAEKVLKKVGELSVKGGSEARKAEGMHKQLSAKERTFLDGAVRRLIRRVAEVAHSPNAHYLEIRLSDLPRF